MKLITVTILAMTGALSTLHAGTIVDEPLGYAIHLPDTWAKTAVSATHHRFEDTSRAYTSFIAICRYDFSTETIFSTPDDWTRANFIAYSFSIDADPFSTLVFYDTVTAKQGTRLWAADAFTQFYSTDLALGDWAEYIRFTATGQFGYEIYAIGPLEDMKKNVGYYVAIIEGITLDEREVAVVLRQGVSNVRPVMTELRRESNAIDLLGKTALRRHSGARASGMLVRRDGDAAVRSVLAR